MLAHQNFAEMTWLAIDFKGHDILAEMPVTEIIELGDGIPMAPGLFYVKAPLDQPQATSDLMLAAQERGRVGFFIDECLAIGNHNPGFKTCLFAGRSKQIAMIYCSQRPVQIDTMARDQATYINVLDIADSEARRELRRYIRPDNLDIEGQLPRYHSYWYDVRDRSGVVLPPAPRLDDSFRMILDRLPEPETTMDENLVIIQPQASSIRRRL